MPFVIGAAVGAVLTPALALSLAQLLPVMPSPPGGNAFGGSAIGGSASGGPGTRVMPMGLPQEQLSATPLPVVVPPPVAPPSVAPSSVSTATPTSLAPSQMKAPPALLRVVRSGEVLPDSKDPVWRVQLVRDGQAQQELDAVIGRAWKQGADRHQAGSYAPLPAGRYRIERAGISGPPFSNPELGRGYWVPIEPLFATGRSALGLHQDPSWGKRNGESGTSGCIGMASAEATATVVDWIRRYDIKQLTVES